MLGGLTIEEERREEHTMAKQQEIVERGQKVLIGNYGRLPIVMAKGEGSTLWDADGKKYRDLFAGFGGAVLGHCHPELVKAAAEQAGKLWHVGNNLWTEPQIELAERLNKTAFAGQAFFCHSGLEANEAAVKLARLRGQDKGRWKVISLTKSFHGRSLAMIAATGNPAVKAGFEPAVPGFEQVEAGDFAALAKVVDEETAAVLMEPIQGEGGINLYPEGYAAKVRELCDKHGVTLIFDEVWTGCGRTGKWFGYQHFGKGIEPDVMTLGKAVGGGLPVGVMFAKKELAKLLVPGKHGCTLGGNPICMAVARTIFDVIEKGKLLAHAVELGEYGMKKLRGDERIKGKVKEVRGKGLFLGVELVDTPVKLVERGLERGVLVNVTAGKVIRLAPPMNITKGEWEEGLEMVIDTIATAS